jgi:hypothetical protein
MTIFAVFSTAVAQASESRVKNIFSISRTIEDSTTFISRIHTIFFCQTKECTSSEQKEINNYLLPNDVNGLQTTVNIIRSHHFPSSERPIAAKYVADANALTSVINAKEPNTKVATETTIGTIYFEIGNLTSDIYLYKCLDTKTTAKFRSWGVGVADVMFQLGQDTRDIVANSNSESAALSFNTNEVLASKSLAGDANGPNRAFNQMVLAFARESELLAQEEILLVSNRPMTLSQKRMAQLNKSVSNDYNLVEARLNQLAK